MNNLKQKCGLCNEYYKYLVVIYVPENGMNHTYLIVDAKLTIFSLIKDYLNNKHKLSLREFLLIVKEIFFYNHLYVRFDCNKCEVSSDWEIKDNVKHFKSLHNKNYEQLWSIIHIIQNSDAENKYIWYLEQREFAPNKSKYLYFTKCSWGDYNTYYNLTYEEACKAYKSYKNNLLFG